MTRGALAALLLCLAFGAAASDMTSGGGNGSLLRSNVDAGGNRSTSANGSLTGALGDAAIDARKTSTNGVLSPGGPSVWFYPGTITTLTKLDDESESSGTLKWTTVGTDGSLGTLPAGSAYLIRVASYTAPDTFDLPYVVSIATSANAPGTVVFTGETGLIPNTTYFAQLWTRDADGGVSFTSNRSTFTTLALAPTAPSNPFFTVLYDSAAIRWFPTGLNPPDASSKTCEGYLLELSSTNFGVLLPREAVFPSSATDSPAMSTLTVTGLELSNTYYMRVASLNHVGRRNYADLGKLILRLEGSTGLLQLGPVNVNLLQSTVATAGYVVRNAGNMPVTLRLWASTATLPSSDWTIGTSVDVETITIQGLFNSASPPHSSFSSFVTGSTTTATASVYAGNQTGVAIPPGASRTFWVRLQTPSSTASSSAEQVRLEFRPVYP